MSPTITQNLSVAQFAYTFQAATGYDRFIPCYADKRSGKKPPCRGADGWSEQQWSASELETFSTLESVGLYLGDRYIALDADGMRAVFEIKILERTLGKLPPTLHPSSLPGDREAPIYEIPEKWRGKFEPHQQAIRGEDKLEIRTGEHYQIVYGAHPLRDAYQLLTDVTEPAELPEAWCVFLASGKLSSGVAGVAQNGNGNGHKPQPETYRNNNVPKRLFSGEIDEEKNLALAIAMLDFLLEIQHPRGVDYTYENRLQIGMMLHSISDDDVSREAWIDWVNKAHGEEYKPRSEYEYKWKSFRQGGGLTFGTLRADFNAAYGVAKKDNDQVALVEKYEAVAAAVLDKKAWSVDQLFEFVFQGLQQTGDVDIESELRQYASVHRLNISALTEQWETYYSRRSIDKDKQLAALDRSLRKSKCDVNHIYDKLPGGDLVRKTLLEQNHDLFIGLMLWMTVISSTVPKQRRYGFASKPVGSTLNTVILAESGLGKSPLIELFTDPLTELDNEDRAIDQANYEQYTNDLDLWDGLSKQERQTYFDAEGKRHDPNNAFDENKVPTDAPRAAKPKPPKDSRHWIHIEGTPEALRDLNAEQKEHRLLWVIDEFVRVFNLVKSYGGAGSEAADNALLIAIHNESPIKTKLVSRKLVFGQWGTSIIGGMQPEVMDKLAMLDDPSGRTGRMLFVDGSEIEIDHVFALDSVVNECSDMLKARYKAMANTPNVTAHPRRELFKVWKAWDRECVLLSKEPNVSHGYKYWLRKIGKSIIKFAGILQDWINCDKPEGTFDPNFISDEVVMMAIELGDILVDYHRELFHSAAAKGDKGDEAVDQELLSHQRFVIDYLTKRGKPATMKQLSMHRYFTSRKMKTAAIKPILDSMIGTKLDFLPGEGYRLK